MPVEPEATLRSQLQLLRAGCATQPGPLLAVLDDIWDPDHFELLDFGGGGGGVGGEPQPQPPRKALVTTRFASLLQLPGTVAVPVGLGRVTHTICVSEHIDRIGSHGTVPTYGVCWSHGLVSSGTWKPTKARRACTRRYIEKYDAF